MFQRPAECDIPFSTCVIEIETSLFQLISKIKLYKSSKEINAKIEIFESPSVSEAEFKANNSKVPGLTMEMVYHFKKARFLGMYDIFDK